MTSLKAYNNILKYLQPFSAKLIAVSKTKMQGEILVLYGAGQRAFGESYVQEIKSKSELLPKDIEWHFIGHLQTNKVKYIAPFIHTIQSVDSFKLLLEINKEAQKNKRVINCLLQLHIAKEETKFGLSFEEVREIMMGKLLNKLTQVKITGLMAMASLTDDENLIHSEFHSVKAFFDEINTALKELPLTTLSMGMSSDYKIAVEEGSNMVRIGSLLFGERK